MNRIETCSQHNQFTAISDVYHDFVDAITAGELERVEAMSAAIPSLVDGYTNCNCTPIGLAAFFGHTELVRYLLKRGAQVNRPSRDVTRAMPLHRSVMRGHQEIAALLLDHGADVNARQVGDFTSLHTVAQNGQVEMAKLLLSYKPDVNARHAEGGTALSIALEWGHQDVASLLRNYGAAA